MTNGWIKLHRQILDNPIIMKDTEHFALWTYILLQCTHAERDILFHGERYTLKPGEFTTGRKVLSREINISESKVQRILKCFESEHQIEQRTDRQCRLIKVLNWNEYQESEQRNEQRVNNDRTTSEQRVNTKQECKKEKKEKNERKKENNTLSVREDFFENFRKKYPGTKRGHNTELATLKKHKDWKEVLPILESALENQIQAREIKKQNGGFIPQWKNLSTWINQRCWEEEISLEVVGQEKNVWEKQKEFDNARIADMLRQLDE